MANRYTFAHANNLNNAHLGFTSGLQSDLNALIANGQATEGVFYLTTDTHRLYIGRTITAEGGSSVSKTIPIPVNEGIQTVDVIAVPNPNPQNKTGLPSFDDVQAGEFYYVAESNVLCIYNGSQWVQINPDTNIDTQVTSSSVSSSTEYQITEDTAVVAGKTYYERSGSSEPYSYTVKSGIAANANPHSLGYYEPYRIKYTLSIGQTTVNKTTNQNTDSQPSAITTSFYINSSDIANVLSISAGLARTAVSNNQSTISLDGGISNGHSVTLAGGNNITLDTASNDTITISGPTYHIGRGSVTEGTAVIQSTKDNAYDSGVTITAGDHLSFDTTDNTTIKIDHNAPGAATQTGGQDNVYGEASTTTKNIDGPTPSTIKVPSIKVDAFGHVASISESELTLNGIKDITVNNQGQVVMTQQGNANITSANQSVYHKITVDGSETTIYNQGSLGTFYSATEVDSRIDKALRNVNALVYKGTVGNQLSTELTLPVADVSVGDTYLVSSGISTVYTKTKDTSVQGGKDYYTESNGNFSKVNNPSSSGLSTYYEIVQSNTEGGDLLIAVGDEYSKKASTDTTVEANKTYYTRSSSTPYTYTKVTPASGANPSSLNYYEDDQNTGTIQYNLAWTYVPSGDDIDTQYSLYKSGNKKIGLKSNVTNAAVNTIEFISGTLIYPSDISTETVDGITDKNLKVAFNHSNSTVTAGNYGATHGSPVTLGPSSESLSSGGSLSVPNFTVDAQGHITAATTTTYTLPSIDNYTLLNSSSQNGGTYGTTIKLFKGSAASGTVQLLGDTTGGISVAAGSDSSGTNGVIEIKHTTLTPSADDTISSISATSNTAVNPDSNEQIVALTGLTFDSYGHINKYKASAFQLPKYTVSASAISSNTATVKLQKNNGDIGTIVKFKSDNLTLTNSSTTDNGTSVQTYTVNLEWGSFSASPTP